MIITKINMYDIHIDWYEDRVKHQLFISPLPLCGQDADNNNCPRNNNLL